jgi:TetR/AcrR family transcriptional regulator
VARGGRAAQRRNAARTRARIVAAARTEFSRSGFAGTRVGTIARHADVTPSLIFYYFQNKAGLYRAVTEQRLPTDVPVSSPPPTRGEALDWPLQLFGATEATEDAIRAVLREGIGTERSRPLLSDAARRRARFQQQVGRVRGLQQAGGLPADLAAEQLTLLLYVLGVYPYMLPQSAHLITGGGPADPAFRVRFETFVHDLVQLLAHHGAAGGRAAST